MQKFLSVVVAFFLGCPTDVALGMDINGELKKARLEQLTADPTGYEGRMFWDTDDNLFRVHSGSAWLTIVDTTTALTNPMTTRGDLIRATTGGAVERVSAVTDNRVVRGDGTDVISGQIDDPAFFTTGAAAGAAAIGIVTTAAQTFAGAKTFSSIVDGNAGVVTGAIVGIFYATGAASSGCSTICQTEAAGFAAASGACVAAWTSTSVPEACADTGGSGDNHCLCAGTT